MEANTMNKELKQINMAGFKAMSDGPGGFSGYITRWGFLDDVGDIVLRGAYLETIPQFLSRGFVGDSHEWSFSKSPGYPVVLREDDEGAYTEMKFFDTPDAQLVRAKAQQRMQAGLGVYLSIGFEPSAPPSFIYPKDYQTELPKYIRPELLQSALTKAQRFAQVRLLPKLHLYEYSPVTVPALESASMLAVKGIQRKEGRVLSAANMAEIDDIRAQLSGLMDRLDKVLEGAQPKPKEQGKAVDINAVLNHLMVLDLQLHGVPIK
jgi:Caudovirus prohead protease.